MIATSSNHSNGFVPLNKRSMITEVSFEKGIVPTISEPNVKEPKSDYLNTKFFQSSAMKRSCRAVQRISITYDCFFPSGALTLLYLIRAPRKDTKK